MLGVKARSEESSIVLLIHFQTDNKALFFIFILSNNKTPPLRVKVVCSSDFDIHSLGAHVYDRREQQKHSTQDTHRATKSISFMTLTDGIYIILLSNSALLFEHTLRHAWNALE